MIKLYSGIPGSGKSYKMVSDLSEYRKSFYVVHNIDGLKPEVLGDMGIDFRVYCDREGIEIEEFFSKDFQVKFSEAVREKYNRNCLIIVDEAHEWFDRTKKTLKMWLSYHRHLNQEVWLVAHRSTNLPSVYRSFVEEEWRAKGGLASIPGYFVYNRIQGGERVGYKVLRKKNEIFSMYKSQGDGFKKRKASLFIPAVIAFAVLGVCFFYILPEKVIGKNVKLGDRTSKGGGVVSERALSDDRYRFAGMIGSRVMIEDNASKQLIILDDMADNLVLMQVGKEYIKVYDPSVKKQRLIRSFVGSVRSTSETGQIQQKK
jgi:hypothetical protein